MGAGSGAVDVTRLTGARSAMLEWFLQGRPELAESLRQLPPEQRVEIHAVVDHVVACLLSGVGAARYCAICGHYRLDALRGLEILTASEGLTDDERGRVKDTAAHVAHLYADVFAVSGGDPDVAMRVLRTLWLVFFGNRDEIRAVPSADRHALLESLRDLDRRLPHLQPLDRQEMARFIDALSA